MAALLQFRDAMLPLLLTGLIWLPVLLVAKVLDRRQRERAEEYVSRRAIDANASAEGRRR